MRPFLLLLAFGLALTATPSCAQSMFADIKAFNQGDVLTVILAERTAAQRESGWENRASNQLGGTGTVAGGSELNGRFALDARFSKQAESRNESVQSDLLSGTMTAMVTGKDPAGNLQVEGRRTLSVNGETHSLHVVGLVRPYDVGQDNTVLSYQIANAAIEYKRSGGLKKSLFKPGRIARLGVAALIGGALAFTVAN